MIGISALKFDLEEKIDLFHEYTDIEFIEYGIDDVSDIEVLNRNMKKSKNKDIKLSIHLPLKTNMVEDIDFLRKANFNYVSDVIREVSHFRPLYFNTHLGNVFYSRYKSNYKSYIKRAEEFINKLLADFSDIHIYLENVYSFLNRASSDLSAVGTKPKEFIDLLNSVDDERAGFCFDLGHSMIEDEKFDEVIKTYNSMCHFNLNDKVSDKHLGLSKEGRYDKRFFYELVSSYDFRYIVLELDTLKARETIEILGLEKL